MTRSIMRLVMSLTIASVALVLSACNTTKATVDTTINFFSSTSPNSLFTEDGLVERSQKVKLFVGVSYENLRQEAARGSGEYVSSLANLYGVPLEKQERFGRLLQKNHGHLFSKDSSDDSTAHLKTVAALDRALLADPSLLRQ